MAEATEFEFAELPTNATDNMDTNMEEEYLATQKSPDSQEEELDIEEMEEMRRNQQPYENQTFGTFQEMKQFMINYAGANKFKLVTKDSHKRKQGVDTSCPYQNGVFGCGKPKNQEHPCVFLIRFHYNTYECRYRLSCLTLDHSCPRPVLYKQSKRYKRYEQDLYESEKRTLDLLAKSILPPEDVLDFMRKLHPSSEYHRDLIKYQLKIRRVATNGMCKLEALQKKAIEQGGTFNVEYDAHMQITAIVYQTKEMKSFLEEYGEIVIVDGTHQSNRNGFTLITAIVIDCFFQSVLVGCLFARSENASDTVQFLKMIGVSQNAVLMTDESMAFEKASRELGLPHLPCTWHFSNNISAKLNWLKKETDKKQFKKTCMDLINKDMSPQDLDASLEVAIDIYRDDDQAKRILCHVAAKRQKLCLAYTKRYFTCMARTTQRAESFNAKLKRNKRELSKMHLAETIEYIESMVESQNIRTIGFIQRLSGQGKVYPLKITEILENEILESDNYRVDENKYVYRYKNVELGRVKEGGRRSISNGRCDCAMGRAYGVPCRHEIAFGRCSESCEVWRPAPRFLMERNPLFVSLSKTISESVDGIIQSREEPCGSVLTGLSIKVPRQDERFGALLETFKKIAYHGYGPCHIPDVFVKVMSVLNRVLNSLGPHTNIDIIASSQSFLPCLQLREAYDSKASLENRSISCIINKK